MDAFKQHYRSNLSPEEFFDVVYEEWLCCKLDLGPTYESCIQNLDDIRKQFDPFSTKKDLSYSLKEITTQFKDLDLETNYFDKKSLKQQIQCLETTVKDLETTTKDLVQKNQTLSEELEASMLAQKKMETILSELQETTRELLKKTMSHEFRIQCLTDDLYEDSKT